MREVLLCVYSIVDSLFSLASSAMNASLGCSVLAGLHIELVLQLHVCQDVMPVAVALHCRLRLYNPFSLQ